MFTKIKRDNIIYYIDDRFINAVRCSHIDLKATSTYAIDCSNNTLIKCKEDLELVLDTFLKIK